MTAQTPHRSDTSSSRRASRHIDASRERLPGAVGGFALFGEALWVGVLVTIASIVVLTIPAALAAGIRSLRRYLRAERSGIAEFWSDLRRAALPGALIALTVIAALGVLAVSAWVATSGSVPGSELVLVVCAVGAVGVLTALVALASRWRPAVGWRGAARGLRASMASDPGGTALLVIAIGLTGIAGWQLPPLIVPALGCLVFAAAVVVERRIAREHPQRPPSR